MLDWFKRSSGPSSNSGIFELYRMQAEEARGQPAQRAQRVRLRVPAGIGRMNMLHPNVGSDGTVQMPEAEAESFLRAGWVRADDRLPQRLLRRLERMQGGAAGATAPSLTKSASAGQLRDASCRSASAT
jgi:hypothetical protein